MVIGMHRTVAAEGFLALQGDQIADHLVDVHVGLGATARLPNLQGELTVVVSGGDGIGGAADLLGKRWIQQTLRCIHRGAGPFDPREGMDQLKGNPFRANGKVLQ